MLTDSLPTIYTLFNMKRVPPAPIDGLTLTLMGMIGMTMVNVFNEGSVPNNLPYGLYIVKSYRGTNTIIKVTR